MRYALLLTSALALFASAAAAQIPEPPPAPPGPRVFPPSDGPGDIDPTDRSAAYHALFAPYFDEAFKQNMLKQVETQQQRFPKQVAGVKPPAGTPIWTSLGPATDTYTNNGITLHAIDSGRMASIVSNPVNPQQMYVLTAGGGLWRTDNLLNRTPSWRPLSDSGVTTSGGAAAIGRSFDTIYVGLGDTFETTPALGGVMVVSTNGGATFHKPVSLPGASQVREVAVDDSSTNEVVLVGTDAGLFRSANGGVSYTQVTGGTGQALAGLGVWSIKQTSAGWLLTAVSPNLAIAPSSPGAVALSTDHGRTWTAIPDTASFANSGRITVSVGEAGDSIVYAIASNTTGYDQSDMFRSTDGGLNWTALGLASKTPTNPTCDQPGMDLLNGQAYYNQSLLVDPGDATRNTVYAGGNLSLAKTSDGGATFKIVGDWLPGGVCAETASIPYVHADHHTNAVIREGNRPVLAFGSDGGLFITRDGGASFDTTKNSGIVSMLTQTVASSPDRDDTLVSGLQDDGVRARVFGTQIWQQIFGGDGEGVGASQANHRSAIVSGYYLNIYGIQGGIPPKVGFGPINRRYYNAQTGLDLANPDYFPFFTPIATPTAMADPTGGTFFTLTGSTFYKTKDAGHTWKQLVRFADSTGAPQYIFRLSWNEIGISPTDVNKIAVGGTGGHAVITTDGFKTNLSYTSLNGLGLGYASYNSSAAWASDDSVYFSSQAPTTGAVRVLKTTDFGTTWTAAGAGLPDVPVNQVVPDTSDTTGKTLYAATWIGVYVTHDGGTSWSLFGAGLPTVQVSSLAVSPTTHKLRAATYGRGVWEVMLP